MSRTTRMPGIVTQLKEGIVDGLHTAGIEAEVAVQPVKTTRLYRVTVLAAKFKALKHSERQNLVWRIAERALPSPEDQLRISMIWTLTPDEAEGK